MQRDRELYPEIGADPGDHRHHPRRRQRNPPARDIDALLVHDDAQRLNDIVVIIERLAHAHHDNIGELAGLGR